MAAYSKARNQNPSKSFIFFYRQYYTKYSIIDSIKLYHIILYNITLCHSYE